MDRLEYIRQIVDKEIETLSNEEKKYAYIHTYGVAQNAALLATCEKQNIELLCVAAMLHDISLYMLNCPRKIHAEKSAEIAKDLLKKSNMFDDDEIQKITHAIAVHSNKMDRHDTPFAEVLKDSDALQRYLYNTNIPLDAKEKYRLFYILEKLENVQKYQKDNE